MSDVEPHTCPACAGTLRTVPLGSKPAHACAGCGGAWLRGRHLDTELDARVPDGSWMAEYLSDAEPVSDTEHARRTCPECAQGMQSLRWPGPRDSAAVIVERCPSGCGAWVDAGEIDRIVEARVTALAAVPATGLLRAMATEVAQAASGEEPLGLALSDLGDLLALLGRRTFLAAPAASTLAGVGRTHA